MDNQDSAYATLMTCESVRQLQVWEHEARVRAEQLKRDLKAAHNSLGQLALEKLGLDIAITEHPDCYKSVERLGQVLAYAVDCASAELAPQAD
jgi:hypothetical protein